MFQKILMAVACLSLSACATSLSTRPDNTRSKRLNEALPGASYALPMLQYEVKVSYKLSACPDPANDQTLEIKIEPTATPTYVAGERYLIDYRALTNVLKVTDFSIETHPESGTLKAINASAEDKTADVIKAVADTAISAASIASGSPFAAVQSEDKSVQDLNDLLAAASVDVVTCKPTAVGLLKSRKAALDEIKRLTKATNAASKEAEQIGTRAGLKLSGGKDRARLLQLHNEQRQLGEDLAKQQAIVDESDEKLSFEETWRWPKAPKDDLSGPVSLSALAAHWGSELLQMSKAIDPAKLRALRAEPRGQALSSQVDQVLGSGLKPPEAACATGDLTKCLNATIAIYASLETGRDTITPCIRTNVSPTSTTYRDELAKCPIVTIDETTPNKGVFVREPVLAQLVLCGKATACYATSEKPLYEGPMKVTPQLGQLRFVQLTNGIFQNNALGLVVRQDGSIEKLQYAEKASIAAQGLASISAAAAKYDAYRAKVRDDEEAEEKKAKDAVVAQRTEAAAIRADEISKLQYEIDKITKDMEKVKQEKARLEMQNPTAPIVSKELAEETIRKKADLDYKTTLLALKEAEAKLAQ